MRSFPIDALAIVRRRLHQQGLTGHPFRTPAQAVAWSGAVQAQEYAEAQWSLAMRMSDCSEAEVEAACGRGEILRTHVMRPTWHFVAAADLRWLLRLTGPRVQAKGAGRQRELGLDADTLARSADTLAGTLADGEPRTRAELADVLGTAGIQAQGPRLAHAVMHAELDGVLASGPRRGRQHTYLRLDGRIPPAPDRSRGEDVTELVLRYFTSHGPATLRDFAWWSGLTISDARTGVAAATDRLAKEQAPDGTLWISAAAAVTGPPPPSGALLLGTFDETLVAYRDLRAVDAAGRSSNDLRPRPIAVDGRTIGTWRRRPARRKVTIEAALVTTPSPQQRAALQQTVERFGGFLQAPTELELRVV